MKRKLSVEIREKVMPVCDKKDKDIYFDDGNNNSWNGGFVSAIYLAAFMVMSFLCGMLVVLTK